MAHGTIPCPFKSLRKKRVAARHGVALSADGRLVAWGNNVEGQTDVPRGSFIAIATGYHHGLALRGPRPNRGRLLAR
jgi:hypothetical protein